MIPKMKHARKKGFGVSALAGIGITFVVVAIIISFGADILGDIRTDQTAGSYEANVSTKGLEALKKFGDWLPTIALVVVAAIIIGIIMMYLGRTKTSA